MLKIRRFLGEEIRNIINILVLNGPLIFSSAAALMGMRFEREEGAGISYKIFMALLFVLGTLPVLKKFHGLKCDLKVFVSLFVITFFIVDGLFNQDVIPTSYYLQMVCFCPPAICVALTMDQQNGISGMAKWMDLLLPVLAVALIFMVRNVMLVKLEGEENSYDQSASYYSAFLFIMDIFLLRYRDCYPSFKLLNNKWYTLLKIFMLPYFVVICFFSGGRGATVLIFIGILYNIDLVKKITARMFWKSIVVVLILLVISTYALSKLSLDYADLLTHNYERISALIEGGHVNTEASAGRDNIWVDALNVWSESPIWGYGLFSYLNYFYIRPHNIFLEMLLQGGLILVSIFSYILIRLYIKFRRIMKIDKSQIFLMPFILLTFMQLMVSGSYWVEGLFWFILVYIYYYNTRLARRNVELKNKLYARH